MSTPLSSSTPPHPRRRSPARQAEDTTQQVQRMIALQYEQQRHVQQHMEQMQQQAQQEQQAQHSLAPPSGPPPPIAGPSTLPPTASPSPPAASTHSNANPLPRPTTTSASNNIVMTHNSPLIQPLFNVPMVPPALLSSMSPNVSTDASAFSNDNNFVGRGTLILKAPEEMLLLSSRDDNDRRESSSTSLTGGEDGLADQHEHEEGEHDEQQDKDVPLHHNTERSTMPRAGNTGSTTTSTMTTTTTTGGGGGFGTGSMYRSGGALQSLVTYGTLSGFRDAMQEQLTSSEENMQMHYPPPPPSSADHRSQPPHRTPPPPSPTIHHYDFHHPQHPPPYTAATTRPANGEFVNLLSRKISNMEDHRHYGYGSSSSNSNSKNHPVHHISSWLLHCLFAPCHRGLRVMWTNESLHRAFCYGAIDGMLTGAGIVSAFCGFNLLDTSITGTATNSPQIRALVVAFTAAACFADSVCMAVSHIWTTHVMATGQVAERAEARRQLLQSKAEAKGMLVDMLLSRGMLTLDAKSLADTLEGYPDMFVSILTGESLWGATPPMLHNTSSGGSDNTAAVVSVAADTHQEQLLYEASTNDLLHPGHTNPSAAGMAFRSSWRGVLSYGRLTDFEMDPDNLSIQIASREARNESIFMMLGFSLLSVVPSLIFTWVPTLLAESERSYTSLIQPNTLVIFLTACVMWCLGVWKSYFMDSNWIMFGFETVMVLFLCIGCAYCLGALLNALFFPDDYTLDVAKPPEKIKAMKSEDSGGFLRG